MQWEEGGIAPQVIFEILSPGNRTWEMEQKLLFYERYGVQEYYVYDPEMVELSGWLREQDELREITQINGWTSHLLGIRSVLKPSTLEILDPNNQPVLTYLELVEQRDQIARQRDAESLRAERLAAQLRAMGIEPDA